jgi:TPR repeat protein
MNMLGGRYKDGSHGLSKDLKKAEELYQRSYYLGNPEAAYMLSELYSEHIPDQARMMKYVEEGIRRGDARCIFKKAGCALKSGNFKEATRRWMTVARLGEDAAIHNLMVFHRKKLLSKDDLTTALRAHKAANDNVKSEPREYAIRCDAFREKNLSDRERVTARIVVSS